MRFFSSESLLLCVDFCQWYFTGREEAEFLRLVGNRSGKSRFTCTSEVLTNFVQRQMASRLKLAPGCHIVAGLTSPAPTTYPRLEHFI
jgi:hypothetical protein